MRPLGGGYPCEHGNNHTKECYTGELICTLSEDNDENAAGSGDASSEQTGSAGHTHTMECYALGCPHERGEHWADSDEDSSTGSRAGCGYLEAAEGQSCDYVCDICLAADSGLQKTNTAKNSLSNTGVENSAGENGGSTAAGNDAAGNGGSTATGGNAAENGGSTATGSNASGNGGSTATGGNAAGNSGSTATGGNASGNGGSTATGSNASGNGGSTATGSNASGNDGSTATGSNASGNGGGSGPGQTGQGGAELEDIAVTEFDELNDDIRQQTVPTGTQLSALNLPKKLDATGYTVVGENYLTPVPDAIAIEGVEWELTEDKNGAFTTWDETAEQGSYIFTPVLPSGYVPAKTAVLPEIHIRIGVPPANLNRMAARMNLLGAQGSNNGFTYDATGVPEVLYLCNDNYNVEDLQLYKDNDFKIVIEKDVTKIKAGAFQSFKYLSSIDFTQATDLESIEANAFKDCTLLTSLYIKDSTKLQSIGANAFQNCNTITQVNLIGCATLTSIGANAFQGCDQIYEVLLTNCSKLESIPAGAFKECPEITHVDLSGCTELTSIQAETFNQCKKLTSVNLSGCTELVSIGEKAFLKCGKLTSIDLSDCTKLGSIGAAAFSESGLTEADLSGCTELVSIGEKAFLKCGSLIKANLSGCTKLGSIQAETFNECGLLGSIDLSGCTGLNSIGTKAFRKCALTSLDLSGCTNLTSIGNYAFWLCTKLDKITWATPNKLKTIGEFAFKSCESLIKLDLSGCTTLELIENNVFQSCKDLAEVDLSGCTGLTSIGELAFNNCQNLISADLSNCTGLTSTAASMFSDCEKLQTVDLSGCESLGAIADGTFTDCLDLQTVNLPDHRTFKTIGKSAFKNCSGLAALDLSDCIGLTIIGSEAFYGCSSLKSVFLPQSITRLNYSAFQYCSSLQTLKAPLNAPQLNGSNIFDSTPQTLTVFVLYGSVGYDAGGWENMNISFYGQNNTPSGGSPVYDAYDVYDIGGNELNAAAGKTEPETPVSAVVSLALTAINGTAAGSVDDGLTAGAIEEAMRDARASQHGIALQYDGKAAEACSSFSVTISRAALDRLIAPGSSIRQMTVNLTDIRLTFDLNALKEIAAKSFGDITLTASRETGLTGAARAAVGSRPAYRLSVGYTGSDGKAAAVSDFGTGSVTVTIPYTPSAVEQTGGLRLIYSNDGSAAEWLEHSAYDPKGRRVAGSAGHFSVYGVGYKPAVDGGWVQNDTGSWLYYENNAPVTGWKLIGGKWYYFDESGLMQAGGRRQIEGQWYSFLPDGAWKEDS